MEPYPISREAETDPADYARMDNQVDKTRVFAQPGPGDLTSWSQKGQANKYISDPSSVPADTKFSRYAPGDMPPSPNSMSERLKGLIDSYIRSVGPLYPKQSPPPEKAAPAPQKAATFDPYAHHNMDRDAVPPHAQPIVQHLQDKLPPHVHAQVVQALKDLPVTPHLLPASVPQAEPALPPQAAAQQISPALAELMSRAQSAPVAGDRGGNR
jgi:hypothetical protein